MVILIYEEQPKDTVHTFAKLRKLLTENKNLKDLVRIDKRRYEIEVGDDILVTFRTGSVLKLGGMRPLYYFIGHGTREWPNIRNFIQQGASKVNGKELKSVKEVVKVIEKAVGG